jgi:uncharacterized cupin superfamily protein
MAETGISHWDDARTWRGERGHIAGTWHSLTGPRSRTVGVKRIQVDPGMWATPLHLEGAEEEIFYVLGGSGRSVQWEGEETMAYDVREGDCLVHLALENAHTLQAGDDGLDVLAFGQRTNANGITWLPRAGVAWLGETWAPVGAEDDHPWTREAAVGPPEVTTVSERPSNVVNVADVEEVEQVFTTVGRRVRNLGVAAGSQRTGLRVAEVPVGKMNAPPHCHSAEEEIFVVLSGDGHLLLWEAEGVSEHEVRSGSVVARPAGTAVAHAFRAGDGGMSLLMYGTRDPNDMCFYPRSRKLYIRGLGLITRVGEQLDYLDGEE